MLCSVDPLYSYGDVAVHSIHTTLSWCFTNIIVSGVIGAQMCLVATGFCSCQDRILAVALLSLSVTFTGFERAGFFVNHIDFAQRYMDILNAFVF